MQGLALVGVEEAHQPIVDEGGAEFEVSSGSFAPFAAAARGF